MDPTRRTALLAGLLFFGTFVFSIPAVILYGPILNDGTYVAGPGTDTAIYLGAFLEILTAIANIGTAVVLFPTIRPASESAALGYVATRTLESTIIVVGVVSLLAVVTLRQEFAGAAGADSTFYIVAGKALVALHDRTFLLGPAYCAGLGNGILLGYLMYRSKLVPRPWAVLGIVAGCIAFASAGAVLFGLYKQVSPVSFLFTVPEIVWELFLAIYLSFHGFRSADGGGLARAG